MTTQRATCWSVTINNPTPDDEEAIAIARQKNWKVEGQLEKGDGGTLHYQLLVRTPQVRFSALKKQFPRAHIEIARNEAALDIYVNKEDTRVSKLQEKSEMYPSLSKYWALVSIELDAYNNTAIQYGDPLMPMTLVGMDYATERLIYKGYHVESIAVNPQVRASWKRFAHSIYLRATNALRDTRQTDSVESEQTIVVPTDITNGSQDDIQRKDGSGGSHGGVPLP